MGGEETMQRGRRGDYNHHGQLILGEPASQNKIWEPAPWIPSTSICRGGPHTENHKYLRFATGFWTLRNNLQWVNTNFVIYVCDSQTQIRYGNAPLFKPRNKVYINMSRLPNHTSPPPLYFHMPLPKIALLLYSDFCLDTYFPDNLASHLPIIY
jgi:hypothetical protein